MSLHPMQQWIRSSDAVLRTGRVRKLTPTHIEADGPAVPLGTLCDVEATSNGARTDFLAEVVRLDRESIILSPLVDGRATFAGALVKARNKNEDFANGAALLGRAIDGLGRPLDGIPLSRSGRGRASPSEGVPPLARTTPTTIFETGMRAIDGLLTLGQGQRVGIFAASGVGKTSLMAQIASQAKADVLVICLVGERGREVEAMWNKVLDEEARARATLVAATSDQPAAMRVRTAHAAVALAEYWRDKGKHVLFVLDSVTRLAMALREIGLAAGEPPTVRAYTPNVFAAIPKVTERCGALKSGGAITAILTVLSESDEVDDPVSEMMKSILDGHIVLSREHAERGHFPPIDVARSVSRHAEMLLSASERKKALQVLEWLSLHESARMLVEAGLYAKGSNDGIDRAIERYPHIARFLKQGRDEHVALATSLAGLSQLVGERS
jgi:flagellum-specific ATP synthase